MGGSDQKVFEIRYKVSYRVFIGPLYGNRVAFAHESRRFGLPDTTTGHPTDAPLEAVEHSVGHVASLP